MTAKQALKRAAELVAMDGRTRFVVLDPDRLGGHAVADYYDIGTWYDETDIVEEVECVGYPLDSRTVLVAAEGRR